MMTKSISDMKQSQYQQLKLQAHYDKLCEIIEQKTCSKRFLKLYFEDSQFKKYYYSKKKNGSRSF
jgi:hypothetical protein